MLADHYNNHLQKLRASLSVLVAPMQYMVDLPIAAIDWMSTSVATHQALLKENAHLRAEQLLLRSQVQKFIGLEKENRRLRALLQSSPRAGEKVLVARLLAVDSDPYVHQLVLASGKEKGIFVGQAVLDANGVLGQIMQVSPLTSQVLLITDTRSAIPVQDNRNGVRAIAVGTGVGTLALSNVPKTTTIKPGDVMVTSGLGQRFPAGYPVGVVTAVVLDPGQQFATITLKPSAEISRSRLVLLIWPDNNNA